MERSATAGFLGDIDMEQQARLYFYHGYESSWSKPVLQTNYTRLYRMLDRQTHTRRVGRVEEVFAEFRNVLREALFGEVVIYEVAISGNVSRDCGWRIRHGTTDAEDAMLNEVFDHVRKRRLP